MIFNVDGGSNSNDKDVVKTTEQTLTNRQKKQARDNIDALKKVNLATEGNIPTFLEGGELDDSGRSLDSIPYFIFTDNDMNAGDPAIDGAFYAVYE